MVYFVLGQPGREFPGTIEQTVLTAAGDPDELQLLAALNERPEIYF